MRMILYVTFPTEKFNAAIKDGSSGAKIKRILEDTKPEAVYFGERRDGERGAVVVVDIPSPADLPAITEPWFLTFDAKVEVRMAMTPEDLGNANFDELIKKYA
ncbi:MAG: panthothenate synthetase [Planctomycetota bacterium]|nr:panthothenate synthetase [Planctomycetota bacterium]